MQMQKGTELSTANPYSKNFLDKEESWETNKQKNLYNNKTKMSAAK